MWRLHTNPMTWKDAAAACEADGAVLAQWYNKISMWNVTHTLLKGFPDGTMVWIGLYQEGTNTWVSFIEVINNTKLMFGDSYS